MVELCKEDDDMPPQHTMKANIKGPIHTEFHVFIFSIPDSSGTALHD